MGPRRKSKLAGWNCDSMIGVGAVIQLSRMAALRSRSEKTPRALRALVFTGLRTMRPLSTPRTRASRRAPAGGPEASRPEDAEDDRGDERLDPEVDRERHLVGRDGEDREWREEVCEEACPERARTQRVSQGGMGSGGRGPYSARNDTRSEGPLPPLHARPRRRSFLAP